VLVSCDLCTFRFKWFESGDFGLIDKQRPGGPRQCDSDAFGTNTKRARGTIGRHYSEQTLLRTVYRCQLIRSSRELERKQENGEERPVKMSRDNGRPHIASGTKDAIVGWDVSRHVHQTWRAIRLPQYSGGRNVICPIRTS